MIDTRLRIMNKWFVHRYVKIKLTLFIFKLICIAVLRLVFAVVMATAFSRVIGVMEKMIVWIILMKLIVVSQYFIALLDPWWCYIMIYHGKCMVYHDLIYNGCFYNKNSEPEYSRTIFLWSKIQSFSIVLDSFSTGIPHFRHKVEYCDTDIIGVCSKLWHWILVLQGK